MTGTPQLRRIRFWLVIFMLGLVLSGITAFPLQREVGFLLDILRNTHVRPIALHIQLLPWIARVDEALRATNARFPFLAYGTDWLAFAHLVIAAAFIGPYLDPVRNRWVLDFGLIGCAGVIPLALIAGTVRGIPFWWRLVDCSFGVIGCIPLLLCRRYVDDLERLGR